jgi:hypothetical protein
MAKRLNIVLPPDIIAGPQWSAETFAADTGCTSEFYRERNAKSQQEIARAVEVARGL